MVLTDDMLLVTPNLQNHDLRCSFRPEFSQSQFHVHHDEKEARLPRTMTGRHSGPSRWRVECEDRAQERRAAQAPALAALCQRVPLAAYSGARVSVLVLALASASVPCVCVVTVVGHSRSSALLCCAVRHTEPRTRSPRDERVELHGSNTRWLLVHEAAGQGAGPSCSQRCCRCCCC